VYFTDRGIEELDAAVATRRSGTPRQRRRNRARIYEHAAAAQGFQRAATPKDGFKRGRIAQNGDQHIGSSSGFARTGRGLCAGGGELGGFAPRTIPCEDRKARLQ